MERFQMGHSLVELETWYVVLVCCVLKLRMVLPETWYGVRDPFVWQLDLEIVPFFCEMTIMLKNFPKVVVLKRSYKKNLCKMKVLSLLQLSAKKSWKWNENAVISCLFLLFYLTLHCFLRSRVRIIAVHFANCEVNSSHCNCKVVNHTKNAKQFFPQGKFTSSRSYSSSLYPYFIHPLHAIISRTIAYTQNYIGKCKNCFVVLTKLLPAAC